MTDNGFNLKMILEGIRSESLQHAREREKSMFAELAGENQEHFVLFGAGHLGQAVLRKLENIKILPTVFADNNARLWHTKVAGVEVLPPSVAADRFRDSACFVVTVYNSTPVRDQLRRLGCRNVVPFAALCWNYPEILVPTMGIDLPYRLSAFVDDIAACNEFLADEKSRRELAGQIRWRYWLDYDALPPPLAPANTYFPLDLITPAENEVFVDCGSFDGDILPAFLSFWKGKFQHIFALEPDTGNRLALDSRIVNLGLKGRATVFPYAVSDKSGKLSFSSTGTMASRISEDGSASVECRKLDEIPWSLTPTYIKMDIEGAEPQAILGARNLLRDHHPILAVCTYHRTEHLWQIPNLIHSVAPEYNVFLRRYAEECWEGVCYAIPNHRLVLS